MRIVGESHLTRRRAARSIASIVLLLTTLAAAGCQRRPAGARADFYPSWADSAIYNEPLWVRDTDGAIGRLSLHPKPLTLQDLARMHGHLCDGLVVAWVELHAALGRLFPDGVVDRTDLRVASKNGPCWADAAAWMTGARVNHGTLVLDNAVGDGFLVQRVSTGATVRVALAPGVYPPALATLERSIRERRARGETVGAADIDRFETGAAEFSRRLLNTPPELAVSLSRIPGDSFLRTSRNPVAPRSDIINRDQPRAASATRLQ